MGGTVFQSINDVKSKTKIALEIKQLSASLQNLSFILSREGGESHQSNSILDGTRSF